MPSTGRRPRIPPELASRIDEARGDIPFERFVCETLERALSPQSDVQDSLWSLFREEAIAEDMRRMDAEYARFRDRVGFRRELEDYERDADLTLTVDAPQQRTRRFLSRQPTRG